MICQSCVEAGRLNADALRVYDEQSAEYLKLRSIEKHGECPGRCDCEHKTGDWRSKFR